MLHIRARLALGAMAIKGYSAFPKAAVLLEPHNQIVLCHIPGTDWASLTPLQRSSRCILRPQLTGPDRVDLARELKIVEHETDSETIIVDALGTRPKYFEKRLWGRGN